MAGAQGEPLSIDVAYVGKPGAQNILVITSGVHGVEGHAGSALQTDLLARGALASDVGIVLVHAVNPFGMSWTCVETEDGIDLNRNFLDFTKPLPRNPAYDEVDAFMCCTERFGPARDAMNALQAEYVSQHSTAHYYAALANGQYHRPGRFNFGGNKPSWSNATLRKVLSSYASSAKRLGFIDVHTGYGRRGEGLILCPNRDSRTTERAKSWWGEITLEPSDDFPYAPQGCLTFCLFDMFPDSVVTAAALEFGTEPPYRVIEAMRNGFWLMNYASPTARIREEFTVRAELEACFAPRDTGWRTAVLQRGREVINAAIKQLTDHG
jgi:hypothetical protein